MDPQRLDGLSEAIWSNIHLADLDAALALVERQGALVAPLNDPESDLEVALNRAFLTWKRGDRRAAYAAMTRIAAQSRRPLQRSTALRHMGWLALELGALADARTHFERSVALAQAAENPLFIIESRRGYASALSRLGRTTEARAIVEEVLEWYEARDFQAMAADVLNTLGAMASDDGDLAAAELHYREARERQRMLLGGTLRAIPSLNVGTVLVLTGRVSESGRFFEEAHGLSMPGFIRSLSALGRLVHAAHCGDAAAWDTHAGALDALAVDDQLELDVLTLAARARNMAAAAGWPARSAAAGALLAIYRRRLAQAGHIPAPNTP